MLSYSSNVSTTNKYKVNKGKSEQRSIKQHYRHRGRVVKAMDLKSIGISRVGSNPAGVVLTFFLSYPFCKNEEAK